MNFVGAFVANHFQGVARFSLSSLRASFLLEAFADSWEFQG